jgi:uncharacterized membrane protein YhaH (DUF805 family)
MGFGEAIKTCFSKYFTPSGRARRSEYWFFSLFFFIASVVAGLIDGALGFGIGAGQGVIWAITCLVFLIPGIMVAIRRLHDLDRTGWWLLIAFVPVVGSIVLLVFYVMSGTEGPNRFGPDPKAPASSEAAF